MGRLCGERGTAQALRAPVGRKKRVSPHPAPKHPEPPRTTPKCHAPPRQPQPATSSRPPPAPHLRRPFRAYILGYTSLAPEGSDVPPRVPAPAAAGASPLPPPAPWVRASPAPSPSLPRIYPGIYAPLPDRFGCPAARVRSCRSRRVPPSRPPKGARGKRPLPRRKSSSGADLFRRPYLGTTAFFIPLTLSMAYRTASMVWLSWSGYRGRTRPLRSRSYS